jgi:hypothetical protein
LNSGSSLKEISVRAYNVSRPWPAAQKRFMRQTNNGLTLGVFVADQEPGRDQGIDES